MLPVHSQVHFLACAGLAYWIAQLESDTYLCVQIIAAANVVWISEWRSESEPSNNSSPVGGDAAWTPLAEGALFLCGRDQEPLYTIIVKTRSQHAGASTHRFTAH